MTNEKSTQIIDKAGRAETTKSLKRLMKDDAAKPVDAECSVEEASSKRSAKTSSSYQAKENKGFKALWNELELPEKKFVSAAIKTLDYDYAAREAGHRLPYELLARKRVRLILALVNDKPALLKPYVIEALFKEALKGNAACAKLLLSMSESTKRKAVSYAQKERAGAEAPAQSQPSD